MKIRLISFTDRGQILAERLAAELSGDAIRCGQPLSLQAWTEEAFEEADALIFVGAAGIAVRAVAPFLKDKLHDPAVLVIDESGQFAVSLLCGHLGGANELTARIAAMIDAVPVITTATDRRGVFAVDSWARAQGCAVLHPEKIKLLSSRLLHGGTVLIRSDWPIAGSIPEGLVLTEAQDCDVLLSFQKTEQSLLQLVPRILVLGVGCRRETPQQALEQAFQDFCREASVCPEAFRKVCSIDLKADEDGLHDFCRSRSLEFQTFTAEELACTEGDFENSSFVQETVGVGNVCERSAVRGSGGTLLLRKKAGGGVTMAAACGTFTPDWRWKV